ncbi:MAG: serine protein kinase RIO [Candidatus Thermoplasmatota archaeon]|nr:serine protein kinase RIO [Candidatus Thermoplasmatota archaeon]MCL5666082.1 serine protein kinase RIO [Candidatus Thermoplasmatota archaeon]
MIRDGEVSALKKLLESGEYSPSQKMTRKTESSVFDRRTVEALYETMTKFSINYIDFPISSGKESVVFKAYSSKKPLAVKVFKTSTLKFSNLSMYINGDYRFAKERKSRANMVLLWTRKEFVNLNACHDAGAWVPEPFGFHKNILVMQYLGTRAKPSPSLRKVKTPEIYFEDIIHNMRKVYHDAGIVHADLSEFNILIYRRKPYFIDMGQSVSQDHPSSKEFLARDIRNMCSFFSRNGFNISEEELLREVTNG